MNDSAPFAAFAPPIRRPSRLRRAITAAYRRPEQECVKALLPNATVPATIRATVHQTATALVETLRAADQPSGVAALIQEYALSTQEGVALMCLAEALLRIPDIATRDALIRDKIAPGDWRGHLGDGRSLFVNAAAWGLVVTGKLMDSIDDRRLSTALKRIIARAGEPVVRRGVDLAMRMVGERFVAGETIAEALRRARTAETQGFTHSYDMLGEAAATATDAADYYSDYEAAIHAIGAASGHLGVIEGPGISLKLSALHPRYSRAQADRVMGELLPRLRALALLARHYDIGLNIDAEEADRLELSLDLLESLALDHGLTGWNGLGFVAQAYGKRCPFVIDWIVDLARRSGRRIMIRLVKGAYWDTEIKRAQVDGLADFPVYTRKVHTDVAYIACARRLLEAGDAVFPQFATHNAQTLATIYHMAGPEFALGRYEFQCLHGMGEPLYRQVVDKDGLDRPCRIYAPVGTHETLLAYLVRRLLENGANSSFVHRIADPDVPIAELVADPAEVVRAMPSPGAPHEAIALPAAIHGGRRNSAGVDLTDEQALAVLSKALAESTAQSWTASPTLAKHRTRGRPRPVLNPADQHDIVGMVVEAIPEECELAAQRAVKAAASWASTHVEKRAAMLEGAADMMQTRMPVLVALIVREAGRSVPNAIAEAREAIDFLRYYAAQARELIGRDTPPLGPILCISPWNFPLSIFTGQVAAALAAGNPVLAKPAEETPLVAAEAVRILHAAGVPCDVLQYLPGDGRIGAALVAAPEVAGVVFTGSTDVARHIHGQLATRLSPSGKPIPLIAETGGQNAMIVDSSALTEQVVADVIASAFDSAGQRCSALRILCLQEEIADRTLEMLKGALQELRVGRTDRLAIDIGPVISAEAKVNIDGYVAGMRASGHAITELALPPETACGTFVAPAIVELGGLDAIAGLKQEVFGPVLHIVRYRRAALDQLIRAINATGYGLTFGLHTRLDETIGYVTARVRAGNLYINRNIIGAVVGSQPFGGHGLSGTGPKAGGPLYLRRLVAVPPPLPPSADRRAVLDEFADWLDQRGAPRSARIARLYGERCPSPDEVTLPGPVGERNLYALRGRAAVQILPATALGLYQQLAAVLAVGGTALFEGKLPHDLPPGVAARMSAAGPHPEAVLIEGEGPALVNALRRIAAAPGPVPLVQAASSTSCAEGCAYRLEWLVEEVSTAINTAAAGGNAGLMAIE